MGQVQGSAPKAIDGFLVLRAYACMLVLVTHVFGSLPPTSWPRLLMVGKQNLTWLVHTPAWSGVWIFFTLSGYLMGKAFFSARYRLNGTGVSAFYLNRAWRIAPLYFLVVAISCLMQSPEIFLRENWTTLARMLTFTYSAQSVVNPDGALWSISTEVQFFLLAPGMAWLALKTVRGPRTAITRWIGLGVLALTGLALRQGVWRGVFHGDLTYWAAYVYKPIWMNLDLFGLGILANCWTSPREPLATDRRRRQIGPALVLGGFVAFHALMGFVTWHGFTLGRSITCRNLFIATSPTVTALLTCSVIICIERLKRLRLLNGADAAQSFVRIAARAPMRVLEHLGRLTYGIYCWHSLVLLCGAMRIFPGESATVFWQRLGFTACFTIVLSELTYRLVELPAEAKKSLASPHDLPTTPATPAGERLRGPHFGHVRRPAA